MALGGDGIAPGIVLSPALNPGRSYAEFGRLFDRWIEPFRRCDTLGVGLVRLGRRGDPGGELRECGLSGEGSREGWVQGGDVVPGMVGFIRIPRFRSHLLQAYLPPPNKKVFG
ncbi:MAG: hypothetical protein RID07_13545, partial [Lacipirellulaceae bacterium]